MKFVIKPSGTQYYFTIVASNGLTLAASERYHNKSDAIAAAESIKKNAGSAPIEDTTARAAYGR